MGKIIKFRNNDPEVSEESIQVRENYNKNVPASTARKASQKRSTFRIIKGGKS